MKYVFLAFSLIFVIFAALQLNDPDPYLWAPLYVIPAILCFLAFRGVYWFYSSTAAAVGYFIYAIVLFPTSVSTWIGQEEKATGLQMNVPFVEEARESLGLMICVIAFILIIFQAIKAKNFKLSLALPHLFEFIGW